MGNLSGWCPSWNRVEQCEDDKPFINNLLTCTTTHFDSFLIHFVNLYKERLTGMIHQQSFFTCNPYVCFIINILKRIMLNEAECKLQLLAFLAN